jgi:hypothetical protein
MHGESAESLLLQGAADIARGRTEEALATLNRPAPGRPSHGAVQRFYDEVNRRLGGADLPPAERERLYRTADLENLRDIAIAKAKGEAKLTAEGGRTRLHLPGG